MLLATRVQDGTSTLALSASKSSGPFTCPECGREVVLRVGSVRLNHFAHRGSVPCSYGTGESDVHRRCKLEIYQALRRAPGVTDVALELRLGNARPDVFARINGTPVAIEVQISVLTMEKIVKRTEEYARMGVYVLWLPQWSPYLDGVKYSPRLWEKWLHATYFGRVYYWKRNLIVAAYHFDSYLTQIQRSTWYSAKGSKLSAGGYTRSSKRFRSPVRGQSLNISKHFRPLARDPWAANGFNIPAAKLYTHFVNRVYPCRG